MKINQNRKDILFSQLKNGIVFSLYGCILVKGKDICGNINYNCYNITEDVVQSVSHNEKIDRVFPDAVLTLND